MKLRVSTAVAGAIAALGLVGAAPALAAGTTVSVRVEGVAKTLLAARTVTTPASGSITKDGAPAGSCPATNAAGALNVATHGSWGGKYSSGQGIFVNTILGETDLYTAGHYWELFVDNRVASEGVCDQKLTAGEQLLFAAVPAKGTEYPLVLKAPRTATVGRPFTVKAFYYPGKGAQTKPVAGVRFPGVKGTTNRQGVGTLTARQAGKLSLVASAKGEIRSAAATVAVGN